MATGAEYNDNPNGVETIFADFKGRRAAMIKALTTDYDNFFLHCDPEKENLCLYGFPNETWSVDLPPEDVPTEIPEPLLGINFVRDGLSEKEWLSLVAVHSDSWLLSVAFYYGGNIGLNKSDRLSLFRMINDMPTISETVCAVLEKRTNEKLSVSNRMSNKCNSISGTKRGSKISVMEEEEKEEEEEQEDETMCGICNANYHRGEFWICCDVCDTWFHGKCVKITQARAVYIKKYKCPSCYKRRRP